MFLAPVDVAVAVSVVAALAGGGYFIGTAKGKADVTAAKAELAKLRADVSAELSKVEVAAKADAAKVEADVKAAVAKVKALVAKL